MATEDGKAVRREGKVTFKRKLTGPPRLLLLGKTRTRSAEARGDAGRDKSSPRYAAAAERDTNVDGEVLPEVNVEGCRGRHGAARDHTTDRKVNRHRWWRRLSPTVICNGKRRNDVEECLEVQGNDTSVPPEGAPQETDATLINTTEENMKGTKAKKRFNPTMWPMLRGFLTSSNVHRTHKHRRDFVDKDSDKPSMTFRKKVRRFFAGGRKSQLSGGNMEDVKKSEEAPCTTGAQGDEPSELHNDVPVQSREVVAAELSVELSEEPAAESRLVQDISVTAADVTDAGDGSETVQSDSEALDDPTGTNSVPAEDLTLVGSPGEQEDVLDVPSQLSSWTTSSPGASDDLQTSGTTSGSLQPATNGPFIRIELVPPDDVTQEDEEEEEEEEHWEVSSSSESHHHLLLLLGYEHSERQLVQTARTLVRAAMNAAVDQLSRERQSNSDGVHREPPGCRDHA